MTNTDGLVQQAIAWYGAQQDPDELAMTLRLLDAAWPVPLILEIGSDQGGTLWLWQQLARRVIAVTLHTRTDGVFRDHGAEVITGDSADPDTKLAAELALGGVRPGIVLVDGAHDLQHAMSDIRWACRLAPGGAVIVHDIQPRPDQPQIKTHAAWDLLSKWWPRASVISRPGISPGTGILFPAGPSGQDERRQ